MDIQKVGLADSTIFTNNNNRHIIQKPISIDDLVKQVKVELGKEMHIQIYWFIFQLPYRQTEDVVKVHVVIGKKMHPKEPLKIVYKTKGQINYKGTYPTLQQQQY